MNGSYRRYRWNSNSRKLAQMCSRNFVRKQFSKALGLRNFLISKFFENMCSRKTCDLENLWSRNFSKMWVLESLWSRKLQFREYNHSKFLKLYNFENMPKVEVFSFLYKREITEYTIGNTLVATKRNLENVSFVVLEILAVFILKESYPRTSF